MTRAKLKKALSTEFHEIWTDDRRQKTLGRIIVHERQFENWWKFEVATHLWELAERCEAYVFVEADGRADVVLATGTQALRPAIDLEGGVRVPIELKTTGTFWKSPAKAFAERGQKRLDEDMAQMMARMAETRPFGAIALLVTHIGATDDDLLRSFLAYARNLARSYGLERGLDEQIKIGEQPPDRTVCAHQFLWVTPKT